MAKVRNPKPSLRPVKGQAQLRELGLSSNFFRVEFLVFYDQSKIREFGYVRRGDGKVIPNGVYQTLDDLGERGWGVWTKRDGRWQVRFRKKMEPMTVRLGLNWCNGDFSPTTQYISLFSNQDGSICRRQ